MRWLALLLAVAATMAPPSAAQPRAPRLRHVHSFALGIGTGSLDGDLARRFAGYDLVVVDGVGASAAQVRALRSGGRIVLAYLDVGTIEKGRPWFAAARTYRLELWRQWGEWYADTSRAGYRRLISRRVAPSLLAKGFDGLFLDNTDMVATHPRQGPGMRALVRALAARVHARRGLLFAQNGDDTVGPLLGVLDGWNREDVTSTYSFATGRYTRVGASDAAAARAALRRAATRGALVTATDYAEAKDISTLAESVRNACAVGALPFVSDIGLTRLPQPPLRCG
ncbi:MAG TPA: endo alpha-1,4 polygalactosaminidase [Solirubrobacteraceae bacterium]|jgi:endo-alpha-1,4-polygalactosaminidase (GH114 family)|nr:endo alpha-1,4 polygalactosaminidase [Solirubrobacteraceae bacterium]